MENLDWKHSIVDLLAVLDLDNSYDARCQLAEELHYDGDMLDTAKMNMWLHEQVLLETAKQGGIVPKA